MVKMVTDEGERTRPHCDTYPWSSGIVKSTDQNGLLTIWWGDRETRSQQGISPDDVIAIGDVVTRGGGPSAVVMDLCGGYNEICVGKPDLIEPIACGNNNPTSYWRAGGFTKDTTRDVRTGRRFIEAVEDPAHVYTPDPDYTPTPEHIRDVRYLANLAERTAANRGYQTSWAKVMADLKGKTYVTLKEPVKFKILVPVYKEVEVTALTEDEARTRAIAETGDTSANDTLNMHVEISR
jgi:hypothetical protein